MLFLKKLFFIYSIGGGTATLWPDAIGYLVQFLVFAILLLLVVAYYTLLERKVMGRIQRREGPNVVGFEGLLQPIADGFKLLINEIIYPLFISKPLFIIAPILALFLSLVSWFGFVFTPVYALLDLNLGVLFFFILSSFGVYAVILAGWASNSKYAFLGAIRSSAQMISYEVAFGFILIVLVIYSGSLNLTDIVFAQKDMWFVFPLFPFCIIFIIATVAETNRAPFDLPEAESEIVAGYHIEYGGMPFSLFFLGEYLMMLLMSGLSVMFFFGGWFFPLIDQYLPYTLILAIKIVLMAYLFLILRAALPRYRYDQLMELGWLVFLPLTFGGLFFYPIVCYILRINVFNADSYALLNDYLSFSFF